MASQKTLMDLFQPAKRLKLSPPPSGSSSSKPLRFDAKLSSLSDSSSSALTPDQEFRVEFNKLRAKSKRNLKICLDNLSKAKREGVGYVKLEELLVEQTWSEALSGELQKPYAKNLCKFVEREICGGNVPIYPPHHLIFNALNSTPFDRVKAVIIGQDPYHGPGQAMGLSFSVPEGVKVPSSLVNIFKELQKDLGCSIPSNGNLERWAIQGVVLLNTVLTAEKQVTEISTELVPWWHLDITEIERETVDIFFKDVRQHQANSHAKKGWEQFTDAVIKTISREKEGVIFLLWGNSAQEKSRLIDENKHHILKAAHPSGLSANRGFFGCRHFSRANKLLEQMGFLPIDWQL